MNAKSKRRLGTLAGLAVVMLATFFATLGVRRERAARRLAAIIADIDRTDPGWRIDDLERKRAVMPDAENFAVALAAVLMKLARPPADLVQTLTGLENDLCANVRLAPDREAAARAVLAPNAAVVPDVLALANFPRGRHAITHAPDAISTLMSHFNALGHASAWVLEPLSYLAVQDADVPRALAVFRARLNCGRSLRDEPNSQAIRANYRGQALLGLHRLLGHATLTADELAGVRRELEAELADDPWPIAVRGERASADRFLSALRRGAVTTSAAKSMLLPKYRPTPTERVGDWLNDRIAIDVDPAHALALDVLTRLVATEKLPWPERLAVVDALQADLAAGPAPAKWYAKLELTKCWAFLLADQARLRSAVAAIAVEQYRVAHGEWPETLAAVGALPDDPYTGAPLLYRRLADGVVVYSVGPNRRDDGGDLIKYDGPIPTDGEIGVRLWDVPHRNISPSDVP